jgi:tetratricopeptide (TPR) repeat protein
MIAGTMNSVSFYRQTRCESAQADAGGNGRKSAGSIARGRGDRVAGAVAPLLAFALCAGSVSAQTISDLAGDLDPLFQRMLSRPADLDNTVRYAVGATHTADIESAISAHEQLLFYNPTLSRVRFELGLLYYRLGSYEMARGYFQTALEMRDIAPDLRQRAEEFIAVIDRKLRPDQISGFAQTGLRYQTNAAAGPGQQALLASGRTFDSRFLAQPDWNWFGAFGLNYSHDFGTQTSDAFEASVLGYDAQQFRLHQFDVGLLELRAGPRLGILPDSLNGASFKPYVVATGALLADTPHSGGIGGGATVHVKLGDVALDPYVEIVQRSYRSSSFYPLASGLSGTVYTYALQASGTIWSGLGWQSRLAFAHANLDFDPYSYTRYTAEVWLPWNFTLPGSSRPWILTPTAGISRWIYKAPDPAIDPTTAQRSLEWRVGLGLDVPLWGQFTLGLLVQYRAVSSNVAVFSMHDLAFTAGPTVRF